MAKQKSNTPMQDAISKKRSEKQMLKKSKIGDEEHKLVSDRLRQLLGWEM